MDLKNQTHQEILKQFQRNPQDTGSSEVQIALLTGRIQKLTDYFRNFKKDKHGRHGLERMISQRRRLLSYLKRTNSESYLSLISKLKLRK